MTKCHYCRSSTKYILSVKDETGGIFKVRECPNCYLISMYPFPKPKIAIRALSRYQKQYPSFDPVFEWRVFLARRYFDDGFRVLSIGQESKALTNVLKHENVDLIQINAISPRDFQQFSDEEFDAVYLWDNLGFVYDVRGYFAELKRILKRDGYLSVRTRDAFSKSNIAKGSKNFFSGTCNFIGRKFLTQLYREYFNIVPQSFMLENHDDSFIITFGAVGDDAAVDYKMKVLILVHPYLFANIDDATGPRGRVLNTMDMLKRYGVHADLSLSLDPGSEGYDLVHLFHNAWETQDALSQLCAVKEENKKVVVSTIYMDMSETNFIINTINKIFKIPNSNERDAFLHQLEKGELRAGNLYQKMRFYAQWNLEEDQRALLEMADRIICFSYTEMRQMSLNLNRTAPFSIVYNSADDDLFGVQGPEFFTNRYGIKDFVISAGHVEWRKNQLMTLYALRDYPEIPIVIVGAKTDDEYYELCRLWAHKNTIFISQLKHRHLASAFAAAKVHVQPSWIEGIALSTIEAAMSGCTPVVADRAGEIEYYGDLGLYVNPGSVSSIRNAVLKAFKNNHKLREKTRNFVRERYTFKKAVQMTIDAYRKTLSNSEDEQ